MSRIGTVRWSPAANFSAANATHPPAGWSWPHAAHEWAQLDLLATLFVITTVLVHVRLGRLKKGGSTLFALCCLAATLLLAPVVASVLLLFAIYRYVISTFLRISLGHRFAGLLGGNDAVWALEDDTSLSVINVLALADFSFIVSASGQGDEPLHTISELIKDRLLTPPVPFPKLTWARRRSKLGYFYWVERDVIDISTRIRWMDIDDQGDESITESALKSFVSTVTNSELPSGHAAGWEILVGRHPIKPSSDLLDAMENGGWLTKSCAGVRYPVLFRIHHSIGDGMALVSLLLNSLSDPCTRCNTPVLQGTSPSFNMNFVRPNTPNIPDEPDEIRINSSWEESDVVRGMKSQSCDQIFSLNDYNSLEYMLKRRNSLDVGHFDASYQSRLKYPLLKSRVKAACKKFVGRFIEENITDFSKTISEFEIENFNTTTDQRYSEELIDMLIDMHGSTNLTKCDFSSGKMIDGKRVFKLLITIKDILCKLVSLIRTAVRQWSVLLFAPATIVNQLLTQSVDENPLHGPRLSGHKVVAWHFEQQDNPDQLMMSMIKRIRSKTGARFSDVLLTAISASLELFYARSREVPGHITVVIPARVGSKGQGAPTSQLENEFSVAMLLLPIATDGTGEEERLLRKLGRVRAQCDLLRGSPDYLVNYWLLRVVASLLPCAVLRPLLRSTHSTLVLSNLPGPTRLAKLAGHTLHDLVFWVPNRTTTGVGLTALSYAGRLQLGLMADRALVPCQQDAQLIVDGVAAALRRMDRLLSPQ